ncbi:MAG: extracellular solute-binding protein [Oscillospiraceae bacterium]|nr:extracellular solute-binding protein [Oscillospiraceae bacterium]
MKKIILSIFALSLIFSMLSACGEAGEETAGDNIQAEESGPAAPAEEITEEISNEAEIMHNLPDDLDFEGYEFKILNTIQDDLHYMNLMMEPDSYEDTGEIINDAAYKRSIEIQEKYNCKITEIAVGNGARSSSFKRSATAGDNAYDIACLSPGESLSAAQDASIYDINELVFVELDSPWWDQNARSSMSVLNKIFFCPGAYELSNFDMTRILLFNKQLMQDYGITEDVYQLANEGRWTQEKFFNMAKLVTSDLNGDGVYNHEDLFGTGSTADHVVFGSFMMGSGEMTVRKDADDMPYFATDSERFNTVFINMVENFYDGSFYFAPKNVPAAEDWCTDMFDEDRLLFYNITFNRIPKFRSMNADFGILPLPKFDEMQENYYCESGSGMLAVIPVTAEDPNKNGAFLEAYAYYGWSYVVPAYKEVSLKTKMARDDESAAMVDLIDISRVYDLGRLFWGATAYDPYVTEFGSARTGVAAITERNADRVATAIERTLELFE